MGQPCEQGMGEAETDQARGVRRARRQPSDHTACLRLMPPGGCLGFSCHCSRSWRYSSKTAILRSRRPHGGPRDPLTISGYPPWDGVHSPLPVLSPQPWGSSPPLLPWLPCPLSASGSFPDSLPQPCRGSLQLLVSWLISP